MKNFLTIDFEVANRYEYSPCAVSIYEFSNGKINKLLSTLINPGEAFFDPMLVNLHGITEEMVKDAPDVQSVMNEICNIIPDKFLFAHNAGYDISKIIKGCTLYNINIPHFEYADTLMLAKRTWTGLINYKLDTISEFLNIPLQHHNADSDAIACGQIVLNALKEHNVNDLDTLLDKINYQKGYYNNSLISAHSKSKNKHYGTKISDYEKIKNIVINTDADTSIAGKYFVFTGALDIKRADAMKLVADRGGIPEGNVTKNTNYLVVGRDDYGNFKTGTKSNKMLKAEQLIEKGQDLEIITEDDFLDMIS